MEAAGWGPGSREGGGCGSREAKPQKQHSKWRDHILNEGSSAMISAMEFCLGVRFLWAKGICV